MATESICPKGWTLPTETKTRTIAPNTPGSATYVPSFSPVMGGYYANSGLQNEDTKGYWWGSTAYNGATRKYINYENGNLITYSLGVRSRGYYIRCVQAS